MSVAGLIHNPRSQRNRGRALGPLPPQLLRAEPASHAELAAALASFAAREVDLLIVSGGDGTLRDVCSALPVAYRDAPWPQLCLLASGNANLVAQQVGRAGLGPTALATVIAAHHAAHFRRVVRQRTLDLHWPDHSHAPVHGFFMGAAALSRATRYAHERVLDRGVKFNASVMATVLGSAFEALRGRGEWVDGESMSLAVDDGAARDGHRFLFLATTLSRLMFGVWPFWNGDAGPLRYLDIDAPPQCLVRALIPLLRGRPSPWMGNAGYRSGAATRLRLQSEQAVIVDGEAFSAGPGGVIEILAGRELEFVTP